MKQKEEKGEVILRYVTVREGKRKSRMAVLFETTVVCVVVLTLLRTAKP